ncbi:MAG: oxidoreductase [Acidobacteriota bacterium]
MKKEKPSDKTVLITGGSAGIGMIAARSLAEKGYTVYAAARRLEKMEPLKASGVHPVRMDLTDNASIESGLKEILSLSGGIDILINNAGYGSYGAVEDVPIEEARRQFEVNLFGLAELTRAVLPGMREKKKGRIINISSIAGRIHTPFAAWYHASKHALEGFNSCLRTEVSPYGIDVVSIQPGPIRTGWLEISASNLIKRSGSGAYAREVDAVSRSFKKIFSIPFASASAEDIARVIVKSATVKKPATRYIAPFGARLMLFLRWILPDRILDFVTRKSIGL